MEIHDFLRLLFPDVDPVESTAKRSFVEIDDVRLLVAPPSESLRLKVPLVKAEPNEVAPRTPLEFAILDPRLLSSFAAVLVLPVMVVLEKTTRFPLITEA